MIQHQPKWTYFYFSHPLFQLFIHIFVCETCAGNNFSHLTLTSIDLTLIIKTNHKKMSKKNIKMMKFYLFTLSNVSWRNQ